jgi:hypothetical protein
LKIHPSHPGYLSQRRIGNIGESQRELPGERTTFAGSGRCQTAGLILSETIVDTTLKLKPRPTNVGLIAWQFTGQPLHEWPSWVQSSCSLQRSDDGHLELRHERQSGTQIVYLEEWLVRDLDGGVCFYTDAELRKEFDIAPRQ